MNNKRKVRLTESKLRDIIAESIKNALNELDWKTYADAAAASDRESIFKNDTFYPYNSMHRHYRDGTLNMKRYEDDREHTFNQSIQPYKFKDAAYKGF